MTEPCKQLEKIASLEARDELFTQTLHDLRSGQQRFIEVLEGIAAQNEQVKTLFNRTGTLERGQDEAFGRIRKVEMDVVGLKEWRKSRENGEAQSQQISNPVKAGLIVTAVVAIVALIFWLVDNHNYTQQAAPQPTAARKQKDERKE